MMNKTFTSLPGSRTVGNYIIGKNLGEGTFGKVKMGIHSQTQEKVAIKILQKSKISDVADVERVTRQINILKQVRHPNIIQLYEIIETPKQLFLVMEYVSEGELFEYIVKKKRLKEQQACAFFQQIIVGVQYLHELGVVHRDLKPENLLIDFNKRIKLVDFGLSNIYKPKQLLKTACGSPCYAAPEMIAGKKYQGLNADIWSCGVILYAMICGYLPFEDPNTSALYKKIIAGDFHIPKFVSPVAKDLLQGILTTDPNRRYSIRTIKNHEWFQQYQNNEFYIPEKIPSGIKVSSYMIPIEEEVISDMKEFQEINEDQLRKYIANNRHNHLVAIYYLLLKKNLRLGKHSQSDICSRCFDPSILALRVPDQRGRQSRQDSRRSDSVELDRTTTAAGNRSTSRAVNRIHFIRETRNNNFLSKKKEESVELKLDIDNLPIVDSNAGSHRRRKLNIQQKNKNKKEISNFYDIEESFRATNYPVTFRTNRPSISNNTRVPISFRNTIDHRQQKSRQNERYSSLEVPQSISKEKKIMNQTFMGRIPKPSIPKWEDESEKIRSILNKTITGHGTRKKNNKITVLM